MSSQTGRHNPSRAAVPAVTAFLEQPRPLRLECSVQPYAWGGYDYLADLLGLAGSRRDPRAELWIGAHPSAPSRAILEGGPVTLDAIVAAAPNRILGPAAARFGELPYLLKVLDIRAMLSIQAHPSKTQAEQGFARENAAGVHVSAPHRNYRDTNHKPETQVALTDFWLLHGFREPEEIHTLLVARPGLAGLAELVLPGAAPGRALRRLYEEVMTMPQEAVDRVLDPVVDRLGPQLEAGALDRDSPDYWAARAARESTLPGGHRDRGIISIYLLNLVRLAPGQGTFIGPGVLHAYLSGVVVELMANSDNVLRGGLTSKHVDLPELLRIVTFQASRPVATSGEPVSAVERVYRGPAPEFALSRLDLPAGHRHASAPSGPETLLVIEGGAAISSARGAWSLSRGDSAFVPAGVSYDLLTDSGAVVFKAWVPEQG